MNRAPLIRAYIADNFAGGGGASLGIELALGRSPDLAVNHDAEALAMHAANHPTTEHRCESVWKVDPRIACGGKPVALAWFSPDCKHHSKAKGGKPREQKIRGLAWVAVSWAARVRPQVIALENVEEFRDWGPLHRRHTSGCSSTSPKRTELCGKNGCRIEMPILARKGETFRAFVRKLERKGYTVEHRLLRACDYGAPTTRRRLFLIARRDGHPIAWPAPTHSKDAARVVGQLELGARPLQPYRTAAEIIDWSIPCPSIFDRERPLADKTMARIARGVRKFVLEAARPFLIPVNHGGVGRRDHRVHDIDVPLPTVTGGQRGGHALVAPVVLKAKTHGGVGNDPMPIDEEPLRTITTDGGLAVAVPYLVHRSNGERPGQHALCAAFLAKHYGDRGTSEAHLDSCASSLEEPVPTISAQGQHVAQVAAFLVRYNGGSNIGQQTDLPIGTLTAKPRFGLVTVTIDGEEYAIVDIGMRMLTPRELFRAQGFTEEYRIDPPGPAGKPLTKTAQIRMAGNSVCPPLAAAIVRAQFPESA